MRARHLRRARFLCCLPKRANKPGFADNLFPSPGYGRGIKGEGVLPLHQLRSSKPLMAVRLSTDSPGVVSTPHPLKLRQVFSETPPLQRLGNSARLARGEGNLTRFSNWCPTLCFLLSSGSARSHAPMSERAGLCLFPSPDHGRGIKGEGIFLEILPQLDDDSLYKKEMNSSLER